MPLLVKYGELWQPLGQCNFRPNIEPLGGLENLPEYFGALCAQINLRGEGQKKTLAIILPPSHGTT